MSVDERKPILQDSGVYIKVSRSGGQADQSGLQSGQQHLIIQPIEFDHKHKNLYGYLSLAAAILVLINYLMIKERSCQFTFASGFTNYDLIQSFHMTTLIITIVVFVLSYFNFAVVIYDFKLLFYTTAALIFLCAGLLIYNTVAIVSAPCVPLQNAIQGFIASLDASTIIEGTNTVFTAKDGIGITVFLFDLISVFLLFFAGRKFYQRA